jgi:small subunit ribosomal protein S3
LGHKVHPLGFRIGVIRDWQAKWYADKHFVDNLQEDVKLRQAIQNKYAEAGISLVEIERQANEVSITIHTAWPGVVIGRGGQRVEEIRVYLESLIGKKVRLTIREIQQPELDAYLVARTIAEQIGRRIAFRRAMKQAIFRTIQAGAKGVRISCAGRLGGAEIARRQTMHQGQVPLHTLRADIDYGFTEAHTTLGRIGIKVWIYKGDVHPEPKVAEIIEMAAEPAVSEIEKVAPPAEAEEKVAKPAARRKRATTATEPEEIPAEPAAEISTETAPPAEPEEKVVKPTTRRKRITSTAEPEEKDVTTETGEIPQES